MGLELFHHDISALFAEKTPPAPPEGYLMGCALPHVQHQIGSRRPKKSGSFSIEGMEPECDSRILK